jgi:hypothetical protein
MTKFEKMYFVEKLLEGKKPFSIKKDDLPLIDLSKYEKVIKVKVQKDDIFGQVLMIGKNQLVMWSMYLILHIAEILQDSDIVIVENFDDFPHDLARQFFSLSERLDGKKSVIFVKDSSSEGIIQYDKVIYDRLIHV